MQYTRVIFSRGRIHIYSLAIPRSTFRTHAPLTLAYNVQLSPTDISIGQIFSSRK